jgi:DNA-binding transcriptional ArsR family regulator
MMTMVEGGDLVDWDAFASLEDHPMRVAIVETIRGVGEPLTADELKEMFDESEASLSVVAYHLMTLVEAEVVFCVADLVGGASIERAYWLQERP